MKTPEQIRSAMTQCIGTTSYTRHGLMRKLLMTDGAKMIAEDCKAHWLTDVIASHLMTNAKLRQEAFQTWRLEMNGCGPHRVTATDGNDTFPIVTQEIEYSDFPLPEGIQFFVCKDDYLGGWVLMLPSEY
jgi:hypothetical protein